MTTDKGGRPPAAHGPLDDSYTYRTNKELKAAYLAIAGPAELNAFMSWLTGDPEAKLPERRPCNAKTAA